MSEDLRSIEEIKRAISDYLKMSLKEFDGKYGTKTHARASGIKTNDEAKGFVKGLRWVLKL